MRPRQMLVVGAAFLIVFAAVVAASVWMVDQLVQKPRDEAICANSSALSVVVEVLVEDLEESGQPISPNLRHAVDALEVARGQCR